VIVNQERGEYDRRSRAVSVVLFYNALW